MKQQHTIIIKYVIILKLETDLQTAKLGVTMMIMNKFLTCHGFAIRDLFFKVLQVHSITTIFLILLLSKRG